MCNVNMPKCRFLGLKEEKRIEVLGLEMFGRQFYICCVGTREIISSRPREF